VSVDAAGTGLDITYKTAETIATAPVFTADTGGVETAGNITVTAAGVSVAAVAAVYQTALTDTEVLAIDGDIVLSDGEHSLTVDASGVSTVAALTSLVTSHAEHADLGFTVSQTTAVTGVEAAFNIAITNANITTLVGNPTNIVLSDGSGNSVSITPAEMTAAGSQDLAGLVAAINTDSAFADFNFTATVNAGTNGIVLTNKTTGVADSAPSISTVAAGAVYAITRTVDGTDAVASGLTLTYEDPKAVLSTPTITADDGGVNIANAVSEETAGFTALSSVYGRDLSDLSIATDVGANTALADLDAALDGINAQRAIFGAGMNRLEYAIDNLSNGSMNAMASRSRIEDADYATETTELARTQIIQQASTAMLAQANQSNQSVLSLLKG